MEWSAADRKVGQSRYHLEFQCVFRGVFGVCVCVVSKFTVMQLLVIYVLAQQYTSLLLC